MEIGEGKDKFHPRTCREDPEGEKKGGCTLYLTSALYGVGLQCHVPVRFTPGQENHYAICSTRWLVEPLDPSGRVPYIHVN